MYGLFAAVLVACTRGYGTRWEVGRLAGWLTVQRNRREAVIERESGRRADEHHRWVVRRLRLECRKLRRETDRGFD